MIAALFTMGFIALFVGDIGMSHNGGYLLAIVCAVCATACAVMGV